MDIKNLITFIHVAERNSFTKAGAVLGFSQSTVSFQIKQLEAELGVQLFERINHTVVLTEKGREVLKFAQTVHQMTRSLKDSILHSETITGHVRLAMADSLCGVMLEDFGTFRQQYPGITLKITAAGTQEMFRLLNHNEADLILTLDSHIYNTEYVIATEERVPVHFVAGADCPLRFQDEVSLDSLLAHPFILTEKKMSYRRLLDEKLAALSREIQPVLEIGSTGLICSLVEQNAGVSFLPDFVTEQAVREGRLFRLPVKELEIEVWKQLLYHRDKWISPQVESVLQYCLSHRISILVD